VRTVKPETVSHLDAYTAPRLVEYFDDNPCDPIMAEPMIEEEISGGFRKKEKPVYRRADALGVKIKQDFAVGNYDILILAAKQSDGLATFLREEGYQLPSGAEAVLGGVHQGRDEVLCRKGESGSSQGQSGPRTAAAANLVPVIRVHAADSVGQVERRSGPRRADDDADETRAGGNGELSDGRTADGKGYSDLC